MSDPLVMLVALGFATGVLLLAAPLLWPRPATPSSPRRAASAFAGMRSRLQRADLPQLTPGALIAVAMLAGAGVFAVVHTLAQVLALALIAGAAAASAPFALLAGREQRAARLERGVWPDLVDHLVSAVRAGVPLPEAVRALEAAGPRRIRLAFAEFGRDYDTSGAFGLALDRLKDRLADATADRILETLRMSREVGGTDLVAVLRSLSTHLRHDLAVRAEIEARQSWIVNAARVAAAAPWIVLLLLMLRPEAAAAFADGGGAVVILGGAAATVVAYRLMRAAAVMPQPKRWFR